MTGTLHIVSTPIGNLDDITTRARLVLDGVDWVACEDTRHSGALLSGLGISARLVSYHEHNEHERSQDLIARMQQGENGALICDAGTPLLSDPGFALVCACQQAGIKVIPVPGASALLAALAGAGLPTDRFQFRGFLPAKGKARQDVLADVLQQPMTVVLYEAPHRILALVEAIAEQDAERPLVLCRELTKRHETLLRQPAGQLAATIAADANQQRGEIVLVVAGAKAAPKSDQALQQLAELLADEMPLSRAAKVLAAWSGEKRQAMYELLQSQKT